MPFVGTRANGADLFFEVLDKESQKKVIQDLKNGITIRIPAFKGNPPTELHSRSIGNEEVFVKPFSPAHTVFKYDADKKEYVFINNKTAARSVVQSFLKLAAYDRDKLIPGYKGQFVIHDHIAKRAGRHFDLRLEFPVASLHQALNSYEGKRIPGTEEPKEKYPDKPGTVYRSFAVRKHTIPTDKTKLFIVETEDHPIEYGSFKGTISEGYGAGEVDIFDKGTFELLDVEGDKKYTIDFHGKELNGIYALVKYNQGYLWVKTKNQERKASIHDRPVKPSFFSCTNYRLPTAEELKEINSFDLSSKELMEGFGYTIVGRGIMREQEKNDIIKSAVMLSEMYPENRVYQEAIKQAKEIELFRPRHASAIDYIRPTMPPDVWDLSQDPPKLKEPVRIKILNTLHDSLARYGYSNMKKWVKNIFISGSSASWNSQENGDLDIDVQYDMAAIKKLNGLQNQSPKEIVEGIQKTLDTNREKTIAPNSKRTFSFMLLPEGDFPGSDGVYDVLKNTWIRGPIEIPRGFDPDKVFVQQKEMALDIVKKINSTIVEIQTALIQLSKIDAFLKRNMESYPRMAGKRVLLLSKVKKLCDSLVALRRYIWFLHDESKNPRTAVYPAFNFSTDWSENYIIFKYIARFGGHEPVQLLYHEIQDSPYLNMIKKFMPKDAVGRFYDLSEKSN